MWKNDLFFVFHGNWHKRHRNFNECFNINRSFLKYIPVTVIHVIFNCFVLGIVFAWFICRGGSRAPPLKLEKKKKFGVKSRFFTRNTQTNFAPPSTIGRNMIFWRKIVIFHTKYPKNFRASLRSAQFFLRTPPPP